MNNALYKLSMLMLGILLTGQLALAQNPEPPSVTVLQPSETSVEWVIGNTYWISWLDNFSQGVNIDLIKYNPGETTPINLLPIASNVTGSTFHWTITDHAFFETDHKYRIRVSSHAAPSLYRDESDEFFYIVHVPSDATIVLNQPNTVSSIPIGSTYWIAWEDTFDDNVRIELYKNGELHSELSPANGAGGSTFQWVIPNDIGLVTADTYKIKVSAYDSPNISAMSVTAFKFVSTVDGFIELLQPEDSGIEILKGNKYWISWNDNLEENVKIELTDVNGNAAQTIAASVGSSTYIWNTATTPAGLATGTYKIRISSTVDNSIADLSTNAFEITNAPYGTITFEQPVATTEDWEIGGSYWISWLDNVPTPLNIELWNADATSYVGDIATGMQGTTVVWHTASVPVGLEVGTYTIRITTDDESLDAFSVPFDIVNTAGDITVVQPDLGGISWVIGETYYVSWLDNIFDPVNLELVSDPLLIAFDEAQNYTTASWVGGSNEGFGFEPWLMYYQGTGESLIGDPATGNISGMEIPSFGLVSNGNQASNDIADVGRKFSDPMEMGSTFSFDWGVWEASGTKRFKLWKIENNVWEEIAELALDQDTDDKIVLFDFNAGLVYTVFEGKGNNVMHVSFEYTLDGKLHIHSNSRDGIEGDFDMTIDIAGAPAAFSFSAYDQLGDGINDLNRANWINNLKIERTTRLPIANNVPGTVYHWNTTGFPAGSYKMRVYNGEVDDLSDNSFTLVSSAGGTLTFNQPNASTVWEHGTAYWVVWEDTFMEPLDIWLKNDDLTFSTQLKNDYEGSAFDYSVPSSLVPDDKYYIQIKSSTAPDTYSFDSDEFEIVSSMPGTITINQPNGGEFIYQNQAYWIVWETDISENVDIYLSNDNFGSNVTQLTPDGGVISSMWSWNVGPTPPSTNYKIKIQSVDPNSTTPPAISAAPFTVSVPVVMSVYPNPASDLFNIRFDNQTDGVFDAVIYDRFNNRILETRLDAATKLHTINIAQLSEGIYFLKMTSGKNVISQKIVVKH
jgi:hypothetical protein